ncbi:MAG: hypothetical protein LBT92_00770 [Rickettsiales bacterium]|jgi:hypothetical protein|nr:hypothetical protein [Rickettsiales bacterium]
MKNSKLILPLVALGVITIGSGVVYGAKKPQRSGGTEKADKKKAAKSSKKETKEKRSGGTGRARSGGSRRSGGTGRARTSGTTRSATGKAGTRAADLTDIVGDIVEDQNAAAAKAAKIAEELEKLKAAKADAKEMAALETELKEAEDEQAIMQMQLNELNGYQNKDLDIAYAKLKLALGDAYIKGKAKVSILWGSKVVITTGTDGSITRETSSSEKDGCTPVKKRDDNGNETLEIESFLCPDDAEMVEGEYTPAQIQNELSRLKFIMDSLSSDPWLSSSQAVPMGAIAQLEDEMKKAAEAKDQDKMDALQMQLDDARVRNDGLVVLIDELRKQGILYSPDKELYKQIFPDTPARSKTAATDSYWAAYVKAHGGSYSSGVYTAPSRGADEDDLTFEKSKGAEGKYNAANTEVLDAEKAFNAANLALSEARVKVSAVGSPQSKLDELKAELKLYTTPGEMKVTDTTTGEERAVPEEEKTAKKEELTSKIKEFEALDIDALESSAKGAENTLAEKRGLLKTASENLEKTRVELQDAQNQYARYAIEEYVANGRKKSLKDGLDLPEKDWDNQKGREKTWHRNKMLIAQLDEYYYRVGEWAKNVKLKSGDIDRDAPENQKAAAIDAIRQYDTLMLGVDEMNKRLDYEKKDAQAEDERKQLQKKLDDAEKAAAIKPSGVIPLAAEGSLAPGVYQLKLSGGGGGGGSGGKNGCGRGDGGNGGGAADLSYFWFRLPEGNTYTYQYKEASGGNGASGCGKPGQNGNVGRFLISGGKFNNMLLMVDGGGGGGGGKSAMSVGNAIMIGVGAVALAGVAAACISPLGIICGTGVAALAGTGGATGLAIAGVILGGGAGVGVGIGGIAGAVGTDQGGGTAGAADDSNRYVELKNLNAFVQDVTITQWMKMGKDDQTAYAHYYYQYDLGAKGGGGGSASCNSGGNGQKGFAELKRF